MAVENPTAFIELENNYGVGREEENPRITAINVWNHIVLQMITYEECVG